MELLADILLGGGALATATYCLILSRKLSNLKGLDQDLGGAIAVLSQQVDEMTRTLASAKDSSSTSAEVLEEKTKNAKETTDRLELLLAALHDLPDPESVADKEFERFIEPADEQKNVFVRARSLQPLRSQ